MRISRFTNRLIEERTRDLYIKAGVSVRELIGLEGSYRYTVHCIEGTIDIGEGVLVVRDAGSNEILHRRDVELDLKHWKATQLCMLPLEIGRSADHRIFYSQYGNEHYGGACAPSILVRAFVRQEAL